MTDTPWSDERIAELRRLVAERLSWSRIAKLLLVTRSAALGKARRLKIDVPPKADLRQARFAPVRSAARLRAAKRPADATGASQPGVRLQAASIPAPVAIDPLNLSIDQLGPWHCRYITNDDLARATYCGRLTVGTTSWCAFHLERVKTPLDLTPPRSPWLGDPKAIRGNMKFRLSKGR